MGKLGFCLRALLFLMSDANILISFGRHSNLIPEVTSPRAAIGWGSASSVASGSGRAGALA